MTQWQTKLKVESLKKYGYFSNGYTYREAKSKCKQATRGSCENTLCAIFETENEAKNCFNAFNTKLAKFICSTSTVDKAVQQKYLMWMPDYKQEWTDEKLYKYFDLTKEEIEAVEKAII